MVKNILKGIVLAYFIQNSFFGFSQYNTPLSREERMKIDPKLTELWEPKVPTVIPANNGAAPSDAILLFDGSDFSNWTGKNGEVAWFLNQDASMTVKPSSGAIKSKQAFGCVQLHLEWKSPLDIENKTGQKRGNSSVFMQGRYEIQVLDNNNNETYSNGQVGSIYKQAIPLAMAAVPTGKWNTFDIIYHQPAFDSNGELLKKATITVLHNGVLIQDHFVIQGATVFRGPPTYSPHAEAPLLLQDHGDLVSYRNIWVRKLHKH